ncbi:MAG: DUF362 domain-containing protein [Armatimonadetes bacterium]|nr:DUF362 domain-containing protein [Armatimonadota bacterium]
MSLPKGKVLKSVKIIQPVLEADCFINVPVAKVHSSAILTMGLKNLMGIVEDRDYWHTAGLHQCIADMITGFRPHLTVIDATRILLTNGPKGPGEVRNVGQVIASADPLAADAYGATLFGKRPGEIPYLVSARAQTSGEIELGKIEITKV